MQRKEGMGERRGRLRHTNTRTQGSREKTQMLRTQTDQQAEREGGDRTRQDGRHKRGDQPTLSMLKSSGPKTNKELTRGSPARPVPRAAMNITACPAMRNVVLFFSAPPASPVPEGLRSSPSSLPRSPSSWGGLDSSLSPSLLLTSSSCWDTSSSSSSR